MMSRIRHYLYYEKKYESNIILRKKVTDLIFSIVNVILYTKRCPVSDVIGICATFRCIWLAQHFLIKVLQSDVIVSVSRKRLISILLISVN